MGDVKKFERKRKKFAARLRNTKEIECKDEPGPNIVLCNAGQATGLEKQDILKILEHLGGIELVKFIAEKGESHSFLVFYNAKDAQLFYETWNGRVMTADNPSPIYMAYVSNVPETEVICSNRNPSGLTLIPNFISDEEEKQLMQLFDWTEESNLKNRLVKHYGYEFRYGSNDVDLTSPLEKTIPVECDILWKRLKVYGVEFDIPDQLTVNKYTSGQGIPSHVDRHSPFGNTILSLSLGSSVVMDWKHHSGRHVPVVVPSRSLLVMQDEARYDWQHGIQPRTWDPVIETRSDLGPVRVITHDTVSRGTRISLTFRKTRAGPCDCGYRVLCDVSRTSEEDEIKDDVASALEELHVHQVYEQIAAHFSRTRHTVWPAVAQFVRDAEPGAILLDLGAGNGKNLLPRNDMVQIGCERSGGLVAECARRLRAGRECDATVAGGGDCVRLDMLRAPLKDACADLLLCIAVVHHFSSTARRREAITTIARLLRPGGRALITVWAKDQSKSNYLCREKQGSEDNCAVVPTVGGVTLPVHENRTQFRHSDLLVPWKLRGQAGSTGTGGDTTLLRYYHVFEQGELESLCSLPDLVVETSFYDEGNWCVICKKI